MGNLIRVFCSFRLTNQYYPSLLGRATTHMYDGPYHGDKPFILVVKKVVRVIQMSLG